MKGRKRIKYNKDFLNNRYVIKKASTQIMRLKIMTAKY